MPTTAPAEVPTLSAMEVPLGALPAALLKDQRLTRSAWAQLRRDAATKECTGLQGPCIRREFMAFLQVSRGGRRIGFRDSLNESHVSRTGYDGISVSGEFIPKAYAGSPARFRVMPSSRKASALDD